MRKIISVLIVLLALGCAKEELLNLNDTASQVYLQAAFPPHSCENLKPVYAVIDFYDFEISIPVNEIFGGIKSLTFELPQGTYMIQSIEVFNYAGELTHWVVDDFSYSVHVGMIVPFKQRIQTDVVMISGQVFCYGL